MKFGCLKNGGLWKTLIGSLLICYVGVGGFSEGASAVLRDKIWHFGFGKTYIRENDDLCDICKITYDKDQQNNILLKISVEAKGFTQHRSSDYKSFLGRHRSFSSACDGDLSTPLKFAFFKKSNTDVYMRSCPSSSCCQLERQALLEGELKYVATDKEKGIGYFSGAVPLKQLIEACKLWSEQHGQASDDKDERYKVKLEFFVNSVADDNCLGLFSGDSDKMFGYFSVDNFVDDKGNVVI